MSSRTKVCSAVALSRIARHVGEAEILADVEAHLGELDRDVDLDAARGHPVEHLQILVAGGGGLGVPGDALAQQVERGGDPAAS